MEATAPWPVPPPVERLARAIAERGGRALVVGGAVRDRLAGLAARDLDLEVFGLEAGPLGELLRSFGFAGPVGRGFASWRDARSGVDVALPRSGGALYRASDPDSLGPAFREASRHRDLTIDAMGWDPLGERLLDPWQGRRDLVVRRLRAVDATTFGADPLRVLRVARLAAAFEATPDAALVELGRGLDLSRLPAERIAGELLRMLVGPARPSRAFRVLEQMEQLAVFAPLPALRGVPQDPVWHPEGDVWTHTLLVLDRAAEIGVALDEEERSELMLSALCHDLGKPGTTRLAEGRIRSLGHEAESARRAGEWLRALRLPERRVRAVTTLVALHLAPSQLVGQGAGARAYRRLARRLAAGGVSFEALERLARADHWGRTTADAAARRYDAGRRFLEAAEAAAVRDGVAPDVVAARDAMRRGVVAGPELGSVLARCRAVQDETGWRDPDRILDRVLDAPDADASKPAAGEAACERD